MSKTDLVRASRSGDQFHYVWAARRCLRLLDPSLDLAAVAIEGVSQNEGHRQSVSEAGEEVVDVAEYYGSDDFSAAREVVYRQLKHSTHRVDKPWTPSALTKTIKGFAKKHRELVKTYGEAAVSAKVTYRLVTNRGVSAAVRQAVAELGEGSAPSRAAAAAAKRLRDDTKLRAGLIRGFFAAIRLEDSEARFTDQKNVLSMEFSEFLAGEDLDAANRLRTFVSEKATAESAGVPAIVAGDVLAVLRIGPDRLFPAPSFLVEDPTAVPREQEAELARRVRESTSPVLILAPGGVGKSVLATRLPALMPPGSAAVVFDCFANGDYRRLSQHRHLHDHGLVQIANELARSGLCMPLLPTSNATPQDYMRGVLGRLRQARQAVRARGPDALVLIVVDAADNAQTAAEEAGGERAFVQDFIAESMPEGVRLVMLCRPERADKLKAPPTVIRLPLAPFTPTETATLLRRVHPDASDVQLDQFHRLSSHNPRVQANALSVDPDLPTVLRSLGPNPTTVEAAINAQLKAAVDQLRHDAGPNAGDINTLCVALAALRPLIPLTVLSEVSGLSVEAIQSFASDLGNGRWLWLAGDALQFRDEPAETWFRATFTGTPAQLRAFVERLNPLADRDGYAAATLPSLMLECGQIDELVSLALSEDRLPADRPLERREISVERLRFALRASLAAQRWEDAAKLSQKAGQETSGQSRHEALLEGNTDLVGALLDAEQLQEIAARRSFGGGAWFGDRYAYEASLLSAKSSLRGEALNRLSTAVDLLNAWGRRRPTDEEAGDVSDEDRVEFMWALLNLRGPQAAAGHLTNWRSKGIWFDTAYQTACRLVDHGRFADVEALGLEAVGRKAAPIAAAVTLALSDVARTPPEAVVKFALQNFPAPTAAKLAPSFDDDDRPSLRTAVAIAEAAAGLKCAPPRNIAAFLARWLRKTPSRSIGDVLPRPRTDLLRGYTLRAALLQRPVGLADLAPENLLAEVSNSAQRGRTSDGDDFKARVGASLPWWRLRAQWIVDPTAVDLIAGPQAAAVESKAAYGYYEGERSVQDEVTQAYIDLVARSAGVPGQVDGFLTWLKQQRREPWLPTRTTMTRLAARTAHLEAHAHDWAHSALELEASGEGEDSSSRIDSIVGVARALLSLDPTEAQLVFDRAVEIASRFGDEAHARWQSILSLAEAAAVSGVPDQARAYRLARSAEFAKTYIEDHFPWSDTVAALVDLAPTGAIATVSRWRDREVGWHKDLYRTLWRHLLERSLVDPRLAPAWLGFQYSLEPTPISKSALEAASSHAERAVILEMVLRAVSISGAPEVELNELRDLATLHGADTSMLAVRIAMESAERTPETYGWSSASRADPDRRAWKRRLSKLRCSTFAEAATAQKTFYGGGYDSKAFWSAIAGQLSAGDIVPFIRAALGPDGLDGYEIEIFVGVMPTAWRSRLAVKAVLRESGIALLQRESWRTAHPYAYSPHRIETICGWSGIDLPEARRIVLSAMAQDPSTRGGEDYFNVAGVLAGLLTPSEAQPALAYALELIEVAMPEDFGDGAWRPGLEAPDDASAALAGLLWATLGDVRSDIRWQATHVVRNLVRLDRLEVIADLLRWADGRTAGPFSGEGLAFYVEEARHHLLIALARAAIEHPQGLVKLADALLNFARRDQPNVVTRHYAARARLALVDAGVAPLAPALELELRTINTPAILIEERVMSGPPSPSPAPQDEDRFAFDYDLSKSMMAGLAMDFGVPLPTLEAAAADVVHNDWGLDANGYWDREPRRNQRMMSGRTRRDGSVDTWSAYLSRHASYVVAGKWLDTMPVRKSHDEDPDDFSGWLKYRLLTRDDGLWLADRRDLVAGLTLPDVKHDLWPWSVQRQDFAPAIGLDGPWLTVWGDRQDRHHSLIQSYDVRSALVSSEKASALLMAAQTARSTHEVTLPSADYDGDIDEGPYRLRAWVTDLHREHRGDEADPWAGSIVYPGPLPAPAIVDALGLSTRDDGRSWRQPGTATDLFAASIWGIPKDSRDEEWPPHGALLKIRRRSLARVLRTLRMDLILTVQITRSVSFQRYHWGEDGGFSRPGAYFMSFLFRQDGRVETIF